MMLNKNTKVKSRSLNEDIEFISIVADVLQQDAFFRYLFMIFLDNGLRMLIDLIKENCFTRKNARIKPYPTETTTDTDYADDMALLTNTPIQVKSLRHSLEYAAEGIGHYVNAVKME